MGQRRTRLEAYLKWKRNRERGIERKLEKFRHSLLDAWGFHSLPKEIIVFNAISHYRAKEQEAFSNELREKRKQFAQETARELDKAPFPFFTSLIND
ncbi:MAG TPA: hypothetical protein VFE88_01050 [Candidatus Nanoarchaeia archaeon]|nr:hypothetical protein [Candidatus Nanoarchaeia archaeon]